MTASKFQATVTGICQAAGAGDLDAVKAILQEEPALIDAKYPQMWPCWTRTGSRVEKPLHIAAVENHPAIVGYLLEKGSDPSSAANPFSPDWRQAMEMARYCENEETIAAIAQYFFQRVEADPELLGWTDAEGNTLLHLALYAICRPLFAGLLERGADPESADPGGNTPLHVALHMSGFFGPMEAPDHPVQALLQRGVAVDLWCAAALGDMGRARQLLAEDQALANHCISAPGGGSNGFPITIAVRNGRFEMIKLLLEHGAHPDAPGGELDYGHPAVLATKGGRLDIVHLLLDYGADPSKSVIDAAPNLTSSILKTGDQELIDRIYALGGRPEIHGYVRTNNLPVLAELIDHCPDAPALRPGWKANTRVLETIRTHAAVQGNLEVMAMCVRARPQEVGGDLAELTAGAFASKNRTYPFSAYVGLLTLLLDAAPRHLNDAEFLPLHWLSTDFWHISQQMPELLELAGLFLDRGVDINRTDPKTGQSPLFVAVANGHREYVELLLGRGADKSIRAWEPDQSPLECAQLLGLTKIAGLLE